MDSETIQGSECVNIRKNCEKEYSYSAISPYTPGVYNIVLLSLNMKFLPNYLRDVKQRHVI